MCYLCYIRKRDNKPTKLNDMKVRKNYQVQVECDSLEEYLEEEDFDYICELLKTL